ncbi:MAG: PSD1 and planctomycete cytochrome C domain-containing protein [Planctomycetaceae bacterium]|nr:PSD1 and planctomycete cytochrome C domain-containing protein [Planctomycetaceae bacterium]
MSRRFLAPLLLAFLALGSLVDGGKAAETPIDFGRQIRPILANNCLKCHGPDAAQRQAGLRLDVRQSALAAAESGEIPITPGKPEQSELVRRISSTDPDVRMPPAEAKKTLTAEEIALLARWIAEGAKYETHWAFTAPQRPAVPETSDVLWPRGSIDRFILARLAREGLAPSPAAARHALIRRLSLDLTGFPPTPAEVDAFLADGRPDAYEREVDRLMSSPHYGERMAVDWLDAARFADTHGYHIDSGRDMTRWREYVIDSFNRNTPYNQFAIEQLAGDLLPETGDPQRDLSQKIASGFNRNHMINFEGGAIPEEYLNAYIIDRVNTTGTVFLGLTVACTQCHDHKYDPLTQREFYQLYAFFNNVPEQGLDGRKGNAVPLVRVPSAQQQAELAQLAADIQRLEARVASPGADVDAAQAEWERSLASQRDAAWQPLTFSTLVSSGGAALTQQDDKSILATGANPATDTYELIASGAKGTITAVRLEALPHDSLKGKGPGRSVNGNIVLTDVRLALVAPDGGQPQKLELKSATASFSQKDFPIAAAIDDDSSTGWAILPEMGKANWAVFELDQKLELPKGRTLQIALVFESKFGQHQLGRFRLSATTTDNPQGAASLPEAVAAALAVPSEKRTAEQAAEIRKHYREQVSPIVRQLKAELAGLVMRREALDAQVPTSMVMQESQQPRDTFLLVRGAYDKKGDKVAAAVPSFLPPLAEGLPSNRLGLARWLVDESNPLTARVTVNRYWQLLFGTGLVKTAEDFGTQGELPSHPELLDWLAVEFRGQDPGARSQEPGWDVKRLVRRMASSAAYRQSSAVTPALAAKDPENRLLARGPRFRLQAEFIRDQALFVSGLYDGRIGGRSVSPYQPSGLWEELMSRADGDNWTAQKYSQDHGADLYRRTMYTFWKRTCPPPSLATLDAPDRETCTVRRSRTNTPLQALVLMNDPTYVEAARKFAERILREGGDSTSERLSFAFRTVLSRMPTSAELAVLARVLERQTAAYRENPAAAKQLLAAGESPADAEIDPAELAAWAMVASAILNTDEALTKG